MSGIAALQLMPLPTPGELARLIGLPLSVSEQLVALSSSSLVENVKWNGFLNESVDSAAPS